TFAFRSRYIRLAQLAAKLRSKDAPPEEILFRLLDAGAKVGRAPCSSPRELRSESLHALESQLALSKYLLWEFSQTLPGVSQSALPCRHSYSALFWKTDDEKRLFKLYREPRREPAFLNEQLLCGRQLPHAIRYFDCRRVHSPFGTSHLLLEMEYVAHGRNLSDWAEESIGANPETGQLRAAFFELWLSIAPSGLLPADLSLSNALFLPDHSVRIVDLECLLQTDLVLRSNRRPLLCLLGVDWYLRWLSRAATLVGHWQRQTRFDAFRDHVFAKWWTSTADEEMRFVPPVGLELAPTIRMLYEQVMNAGDESELAVAVKRLAAYGSA
ncbi:MAG: hypothetical protein KDD69_17495, partial [Bdellovibrionales bacterium]|nr:hypothetical protein [Bdellovibrionales bacterium]